MEQGLATTNFWLSVIAAVSLLEALALIGIGIAAFRAYWQAMRLINEVQDRHLQPAMDHLRSVMDDVKSITTRLKEDHDRVDRAIHHTMDRVDHTVDRVRGTVRGKTGWIVGLARGARVALETILTTRAA